MTVTPIHRVPVIANLYFSEDTMRVRDLMTRDVHTVCVDSRTLIAKDIMDWANIRHVPVVDSDHRIVGLITHRDLLRVSVSALSTQVVNAEKAQHLAHIPIEDVMQRDVRTITPGSSARLAARILREEKYGCLPVVEGGRLAGIVTAQDLLRLIEDTTEEDEGCSLVGHARGASKGSREEDL